MEHLFREILSADASLLLIMSLLTPSFVLVHLKQAASEFPRDSMWCDKGGECILKLVVEEAGQVGRTEKCSGVS